MLERLALLHKNYHSSSGVSEFFPFFWCSIWWRTSTNSVFSHRSITDYYTTIILLLWIPFQYLLYFYYVFYLVKAVYLSSRGSAGWFCQLLSFSGFVVLERSVGFHYGREKGCDRFIDYHRKLLIRDYYTQIPCHLVDFLFTTYNYCLLTIKNYWESKMNNILFCKS